MAAEMLATVNMVMNHFGNALNLQTRKYLGILERHSNSFTKNIQKTNGPEKLRTGFNLHVATQILHIWHSGNLIRHVM